MGTMTTEHYSRALEHGYSVWPCETCGRQVVIATRRTFSASSPSYALEADDFYGGLPRFKYHTCPPISRALAWTMRLVRSFRQAWKDGKR